MSNDTTTTNPARCKTCGTTCSAPDTANYIITTNNATANEANSVGYCRSCLDWAEESSRISAHHHSECYCAACM